LEGVRARFLFKFMRKQKKMVDPNALCETQDHH
jgi:hypothetical protein